MRVGLMAAAVVLSAACGDDVTGSPSEDAATIDALVLPPIEEPTPPAEPALPDLTPCPDGWREVMDESGVAVCDPWPADGMQACADGEAHFPGEPGCARIGTACPPGAFPEDLPTDRTIRYVLASAAPGGDGSLTAPFATVAAALFGASADTVIAIGEGDYEESVELFGGIALWGSCPTGAVMRSSTPGDLMRAVVLVRGAGAEIRNLGFGASARPAITVAGLDRSVALDDVIVTGASAGGIGVYTGASMTARTLVVRDVEPGLSIGRAIGLELSADAVVERAVVSNNANGVAAVNPGSALDLDRVAILDTEQRTPLGGVALEVVLGATGTFRRTFAARAHGASVRAVGGGTDAVLEDVYIADTGPRMDLTLGFGFETFLSAELNARRALLEHNRASQVYAYDGGMVRLEDVVVRDGEHEMDSGVGGHAILVEGGSGRTVTELLRAALLRNRDVAMVSLEPDAVLYGEDVSASNTRPTEIDDSRGRALEVLKEADATLVRARFEGSSGAAVYVDGDATARLEDLVVRGTQAGFDERGGKAILMGVTSRLVVVRALFERNHEVQIYVNASSMAELTDVRIRETLPRACSETTCRDEPAGIGLGIYNDATAVLDRFEIRSSPLCAIQLAYGGEVDLVAGVIAENEIGVCVQTDGFDITRVTGNVEYRDNVVDVEATMLPVPEPAASS